MAFHVSNNHLDLAPLNHRLADDIEMESQTIWSDGNVQDHTSEAIWVIVAKRDSPLWADAKLKTAIIPDDQEVRLAPLWTDQNHNLLSVFRKPKKTSNQPAHDQQR